MKTIALIRAEGWGGQDDFGRQSCCCQRTAHGNFRLGPAGKRDNLGGSACELVAIRLLIYRFELHEHQPYSYRNALSTAVTLRSAPEKLRSAIEPPVSYDPRDSPQVVTLGALFQRLRLAQRRNSWSPPSYAVLYLLRPAERSPQNVTITARPPKSYDA